MSPFLSDYLSLILGIVIHCIQHSQAMLERGVCELAHSFFHCPYVNDREAKEANAKMRVLDCDGNPKLCLFATRDIEIGEEVS